MGQSYLAKRILRDFPSVILRLLKKGDGKAGVLSESAFASSPLALTPGGRKVCGEHLYFREIFLQHFPVFTPRERS